VIARQVDYAGCERRRSSIGCRSPIEYLINEGIVPKTLAETGVKSGSAPGAQAQKERVGAKVRRLCDRAQTPYQRVLASERVAEEEKGRLRAVYQELNPVEIRRRVEENLRKLWRLNG